ncbi:MAG: glycosyltransferase family A protein [Acidimicrobiales bacterium]|nr:glycosyltransferase family 2 protein [Acidimicrobiales bacterium]
MDKLGDPALRLATDSSVTGLVSIGIPVFNGSDFIAEALASASSQTYGNIEILVADNASCDDTRDIVRDAASRDKRIRLLPSDHNRGAAFNYNRLVHAANGEFFQWLAHDDLLEPTCIEACLRAFKDRPEVCLVYPSSVIIDEVGSAVREHDEHLDLDIDSPTHRAVRLLWRLRMCHAVFGLHRRSTLLSTDLIQPFDSSDYTLLLEMALRGHVVEVDDRLFKRRRHASDSRSANRSKADIARWFSPNAKPTARSPRLVRSFVRATYAWAPTRTSSLLATTAVGANAVVTEARWHLRARRRARTPQPRPR